MGKWVHRLSNIDALARRGDCAACGPNVELRWKAGEERWRCRTPLRERSNTKAGVPRAERDSILATQRGRCAICRARITEPHLDHCHETGRVRGVLCRACNYGLGNFRDSPKILARAATYLDRHSR